MMKSRISLLALTTLLFPLSLSAQSNETGEKGIQGQKAPLLNVSTWINLPEGKDKVEITDYKGKIVVLMFFQHWCKASQERELPVLQNLAKRYEGNEEIAFIAVQTVFQGFIDNTPDKLPITAEKFELKIPIGHALKTPEFPGVSGAYKPGGTPWWVIIDRKGIVEYNGFILNEEEAIKGFDKMISGLPVD
jgi:thiol-disulfide isomerase/thioredoxin